jgi:hypothetical protein
MKQPITREIMIQELKKLAPIILQVTGTYDMGFEFSAVVPNGVIYAEPGMLLDYSGGEWPPNEWQGKTEEEHESLLRDFLLDETWQVNTWEDLSCEDIAQWLDEVRNT